MITILWRLNANSFPLNCVQHENAAACDLIIKLFCFVFICKPAGQRRFPWSPTGRRRPGCFTSSVDVTWSSEETRTLETLVSAHSPPLMKFLMKNGRLWQLFWFHKQNVNIFLIIVSNISDVHYVLVSFFLFISENLFKYIHMWSLKVRVLFLILAKLGNFESSVSCFERALNLAKLQDDDDPTMLNDIQKVPNLSASVHSSKGFY